MLKEKLDSIDKKFDIIIKENNTIKSMLTTKTKFLSKIQTDMEIMKKEINTLKYKKAKKSPIRVKKKMSELLRMGILI